MAQEICRLCLSKANLTPIFIDSEQCASYSAVLELTTGLKITHNDGLPQSMCKNCKNDVDCAIKLRNKSQCSERKLLKQGNAYEKTSQNQSDNKNIIVIDTADIKADETNQSDDENFDDQPNNDGYRDVNEEVKDENSGKTKWRTEKNNKKMSRKDKRQMYLNLVDGTFDPKGPVKCKLCKKTLSKWACFYSHAKLHLGFNFVCEFCGKSFISLTQLKRHCRTHHGMERDLQCKHCSYLALDNVQLKLHVRRVHTGERPFICDYCSAAYHSRRCLIQHIESHRTEATVQCPACPRAFKSQRQLSRHRYTSHAPRRACCPRCGNAYANKYLRTHVDKCHAHADVTGDVTVKNIDTKALYLESP